MNQFVDRIRATARRRIHRLTRLVGAGESRRARFVVVAVFLALAVAVGALVLRPRPAVEWAPLEVIEGRTPLQEMPVTVVPRGADPAPGDRTYVDVEGLDELVIGVDLDYLDGNAFSYDIVIRDFAEDVVHREEIPELYVDDGRFLLRLLPARLVADTYTLEVIAHEADGERVVAVSEFEILK